MRAVILDAPGGPTSFRDGDWPLPEPGPGEVRIRIRAAGFNPVDALWRRGEGGPAMPCILGRDCAGTVDALGPACQTGLRVGARVLAYVSARASNGTYAEACCVPEGLLARLPDALDFTQGAALPVVGLTAVQVLARSPSSPPVAFVAGGGGAVGAAVLSLLRESGTRVLTTATRATSAEDISARHGLPLDDILRVDARPVTDQGSWVRARAPHGVPLAIDLVGGAMKLLCFEVAAANGTIVSIVEEPPGFAPELWDLETGPLVARGLGFHFVQLGALAIHGPREGWARYGSDLAALLHRFEGRPLPLPPIEIQGALSAATVARAHQALDARQGGVKRVMTVP